MLAEREATGLLDAVHRVIDRLVDVAAFQDRRVSVFDVLADHGGRDDRPHLLLDRLLQPLALFPRQVLLPLRLLH